MNFFLLAASAIAAVAFVVHTFVGGRYAAPPLMASGLPPATIWLNYLCWHIVTALLAILAVALAAGASGAVSADAAALAGVIAGSIAIVSVAVTLKAGIAPLRFPASYLLGSVALLTFAGLTLS